MIEEKESRFQRTETMKRYKISKSPELKTRIRNMLMAIAPSPILHINPRSEGYEIF